MLRDELARLGLAPRAARPRGADDTAVVDVLRIEIQRLMDEGQIVFPAAGEEAFKVGESVLGIAAEQGGVWTDSARWVLRARCAAIWR